MSINALLIEDDSDLAEAIAAFERTLITHDRFDKFQNGDLTALNEQELRGLDTFINTGCISCHNGVAIGGNSYQKLGVVKPYMADDSEDIGRAAVTGNDAEKFFYKVPSLRNVAKTGPYFHDGDVPTDQHHQADSALRPASSALRCVASPTAIQDFPNAAQV